MKLKDLIPKKNYEIISGEGTTEITGLENDSRKIKPGNMFICIRGAREDGHDFIQQALENGASAVVVEDESVLESFSGLAAVKTLSTTKAVGELAARFYGNPANRLIIVGITGTKGKTTVATMLSQVLKDQGIAVGTIGTLGVSYNDIFYKLPNTTPDGLTLQRIFKDMTDQGITHVVMEASSQGFKLNRTAGFDFTVGLYLNISPDHIGENEHESFEEYLNCKRQILKQSKKAIINSDDYLWERITPDERENSVTFSLHHKADYQALNYIPLIRDGIYGSAFELVGPWSAEVTLNIPGEFNVSNVLAVIAAADALGLEPSKTIETVSNFQPEGRMQLLKSAQKYGRIVFVDFAHNGLSIKSALKSLRAYNPRQIISMFGLHWNETRMRRYDQGYAAGKYSDYTILTSDHKGPVSFDEIKEDVILGLEDSGGDYLVIEDRKEAICRALEISGKEDIVVLFGMGHERSQNIDGNEIYFSEEEIVNDYLSRKEWLR